MSRDSKGRFIKGSKKSYNWYISMEKRKGAGHSMWKGGIKKELVKCACNCGNELNKYDSKNRERKFIQGHQNSKYWLGKERLDMRGENNSNWKGDKYSENYRERRRFQKKISRLVLERDNYTCVLCKVKGGILHVDHIQPFAEYIEGRFDINNCRTLCRKCHYLITFKKEMPKNSRWGIDFPRYECDN